MAGLAGQAAGDPLGHHHPGHPLAWTAPRGIVSAAMAALFAIKLEAIGYSEASRMVPLTFIVIMGAILLQSATADPLAKWLDASEPEHAD